jgi:outer membrane protein assembly factor BamB
MKTTLLSNKLLIFFAFGIMLISCRKEIQNINSSSLQADITTLNDSIQGDVFIANYSYDSSTLYCIDVRTGAKKWSFKTSGLFLSTGCSAKGLIFAGSTNFTGTPHSVIYALQITDGKIKWQQDFDYSSQSTALALYNDVLYIALNKNVIALNAKDGKKIWRYRDQNNPHSISSSPTVVNNSVYVSIYRSMYSINATDGTLQWTFYTGFSNLNSSPCYLNGSLYFTTQEGYMYSLNSQNGNENWKQFIGFSYNSSPCTNGNDKVFATYTQSAQIHTSGVYCLNSVTGDKLWQDSSYAFNFSNRGDQLYYRQTIYYNTNDSLMAFDASSGKQKWSAYIFNGFSNYSTRGGICVSPGVVFVSGIDDNLYAIDTKTGKKYWTFYFGPSSYPSNFSPFVVSNTGKAYYPTVSGMNQ